MEFESCQPVPGDRGSISFLNAVILFSFDAIYCWKIQLREYYLTPE